MWIIPFLVLQAADAGESQHLKENANYRDFIEVGIQVAPDHRVKLPKPFLADGLDAATQRKLIEELGGRRYPWANLARDSQVAPQIIKLADQQIPDSDAKTRIVDVYFIAYGDLDALSGKKTLTEPSSQGNQQWNALTNTELVKRNIVVEDPKHVSLGWMSNDLIDRVRVSGVLKTEWSKTDDSLMATAVLDPRFNGDADFPNRWQPLDRRGNPVDEAVTYQGAGGYSKITRLKGAAGALFVESHIVFAEPHAWFEGRNLLGSKLPAVIQNEVRSTRREMKMASQEK